MIDVVVSKIASLITAALVVFGSLFAPAQTSPARVDEMPVDEQSENSRENITQLRAKPEEKEVRGIYFTSWTAANPQKIDWLIDLARRSEINAVVIDIKDYSGKISYDSFAPLVQELGTKEVRIKNLSEVLARLREAGIYTIARQTVFQDPALVAKKPMWAVKDSRTGAPWQDYKGLTWIDPSIEEAWDYQVAIAREAITLGFDEINFDYIRFPSDGPMRYMSFAHMEGREKWQVMRDFFSYLREQLDNEPAYLSADLFGFTTERTDDMSIGQQIEDAIVYFDYVSPMVYPSHYPKGYLNLDNPAAHPYQVVKHAITRGIESIEAVPERRGKIRPWLQDFQLGAPYTAESVRAQIRASNEAGGYGWLIWNARNVYQSEALIADHNPQG